MSSAEIDLYPRRRVVELSPHDWLAELRAVNDNPLDPQLLVSLAYGAFVTAMACDEVYTDLAGDVPLRIVDRQLSVEPGPYFIVDCGGRRVAVLPVARMEGTSSAPRYAVSRDVIARRTIHWICPVYVEFGNDGWVRSVLEGVVQAAQLPAEPLLTVEDAALRPMHELYASLSGISGTTTPEAVLEAELQPVGPQPHKPPAWIPIAVAVSLLLGIALGGLFWPRDEDVKMASSNWDFSSGTVTRGFKTYSVGARVPVRVSVESAMTDGWMLVIERDGTSLLGKLTEQNGELAIDAGYVTEGEPGYEFLVLVTADRDIQLTPDKLQEWPSTRSLQELQQLAADRREQDVEKLIDANIQGLAPGASIATDVKIIQRTR